jgi:hypothetical protein
MTEVNLDDLNGLCFFVNAVPDSRRCTDLVLPNASRSKGSSKEWSTPALVERRT